MSIHIITNLSMLKGTGNIQTVDMKNAWLVGGAPGFCIRQSIVTRWQVTKAVDVLVCSWLFFFGENALTPIGE